MKLKYYFFLLFSLLLLGQLSYAQPQSPCDANPFCSDSSYDFPNVTGGATAISGPDYGCLGSEPNPIWYYMQIGTAGTIQLTINQTSASGFGLDVDFAMWGPFTDLATGCAAVLAGQSPLQCSYSAAPTETIGLGMTGGYFSGQSTPPAAQVGEVYIVVLTNFSQQPGNITFNQTAGTGSADCGIVCGLWAQNSGSICLGQTATLNALTTDTVNTFTYYWTGPNGFSAIGANVPVSPPSAGTFTYNLMSINQEGDSCFATTDLTVFPTYHNTTNVYICQGETYTWYGKTIFMPGTYDTTFPTINGCDSIMTLNLSINPLPSVNIKSDNPKICEGNSAVITNTNHTPGATYQWMRDGSAINGETSDNLVINTPGDYYITGITSNGCKDTSNKVAITVSPAAQAVITGLSRNSDALCLEDTITISAQECTNCQYHWSPEEYFRSNASYFYPNATVTLSDPKIQVKLMVMNSYGCVAYDSTTIMAKPCCDIYVPTAFSPNNDGVNDYFYPKLRPYQLIVSFQIFDRYGKIVYDNGRQLRGWDGNYPNGKPAANDTYMYLMKYTCTDGQTYTKKADITLVR